MTYRVELTERAARDLRYIYATIHAADQPQVHAWFNGLQAAVFSLSASSCTTSATEHGIRLSRSRN